ncbi:MAG: nucleobase:cation symporter-2 family protein [Caulobacteraceae bacterium]
MTDSTAEMRTVSPVDEILPPGRLAILGMQHVLVLYAGAVAVPLIIGHALGLLPDQIALLISADLFAAGLATLIQSFGLPGVGIRMPIMMGVTFASVGPMMAMIAAGAASGAPQSATLQLIYGASIASGVFGLAVAPLVGRLAKLFPPVVTGTVILVIGISLMNIGVNWAAGGQPSQPDYGSPLYLGIALFTLAVILALTRFATGMLKNTAVLIGTVAGCVVATLLGKMSFEHVAEARFVALVMPFQFGLPRFELVPVLTMCLVMIVIMVESMGMFFAVSGMVEQPLTTKAVVRGLRGDALGAILGGVFNTFPYTSFSQNVGLVGVTGVRSRYVCVAGAAIMILLGLSPKLSALVAAAPSFVLGGAGLVMFGMVAATGVRILSGVDYAGNHNNLFIVAISVGVGLIPLVAPNFFQFMPVVLAPLLNSGILLSVIAAVILNLYYNGLGGRPARAAAGHVLH